MTPCPEPETLERLFEGALDAGQRGALERHIDGCERCAATVSELARLFASATWGSALASSEPGPAAAPEGLGRYQLGRRLGAGSMGMVFEAWDPELQRKVAVKLLRSSAGDDQDSQAAEAAEAARRRLLQEARAMASLAHPHVVPVFDVGRAGEQVFVAMELVLGGTLSTWLGAARRDRPTILATLAQAGRGLEAAHRRGLVHRDFKPDNVLMSAEGRPQVTDFGLATLGAHGSPAGVTTSAAATLDAADNSGDPLALTVVMTERGAIVGTPAYMAPEQWRGETADARSDQFAFTVVLFEALFGARPFAARTLAELRRAVLEGAPASPPKGTPSWLQAVLRRGLARDPNARYPNLDALLSELERDRRRTWPRTLAVAGVGLAGFVGLLAWAGTTAESGREHAVEETANACVDELEGVRGLWTPDRRETLRARFEWLELEDGVAGRALEAYDAWVERWVEAAAQGCEAAEPDDELAQARARCLDATSERFEALLTVLDDDETSNLRGALFAAVHALPDPAACLDPAWLAVAPKPPPEELEARASLVAESIHRAEALLATEQWLDTRRAADRAVADADALGFAPLIAEARLVRARVEIETHHDDEAVDWLHATVEGCHDGAHERVRAEALLSLIEVEGARRLQVEAAEGWRDRARSLAARVEDPLFAARINLAYARVEVATRRSKDAANTLAEIEPVLSERGRAPLAIAVQRERAALSLRLDGPEAARPLAQAALDAASGTLGPYALLTAAATRTLAEVELAAGQPDVAEPLAARAERIPVLGGPMRHRIELSQGKMLLARVRLTQGDRTSAAKLLEDAAMHYMDMPQAAWPRAQRALLDFEVGEPARGETGLVEALTRLGEHWEQADPRRIPLLLDIGAGLLERGQPTLAGTVLERAALLAGPVHESFGVRARIDRLRAQVARAAGDDARALELLNAAYLGTDGDFGMGPPEVDRLNLERADLAWSLGDRAFAERLYGVLKDHDLDPLGPEAAARVRSRAP